MAGVKGAGGPPPKPKSQRRRRNLTAGEERAAKATQAPTGEAVRPEPGNWAEGISRWYESLSGSGQSAFYTSSDWASAWLMCEAMNAELAQEGVLRSATLAAWLKLCTALLVTEGDRRRAALELTRPSPAGEEVDGVALLDEFRRRLAGRQFG